MVWPKRRLNLNKWSGHSADSTCQHLQRMEYMTRVTRQNKRSGRSADSICLASADTTSWSGRGADSTSYTMISTQNNKAQHAHFACAQGARPTIDA